MMPAGPAVPPPIAPRYARRAPVPQRIIGLSAALTLHALVLWLLLGDAPPLRERFDHALVVFDVPALPPPSPVEPPAPPPPPPSPLPEAHGGSPGKAAERPVRRDETAVPRRFSSFDATPAIVAPPLPSALPLGGTAPLDLGSGGAGGTGSGSGSGNAAGAGEGKGPGGGSVPRYARAEWITVPTNADFKRFWLISGRGWPGSASVALACFVGTNGQPHRCSLLKEEPRGIGFGRAAIELARISRVRPVLRDGEALARIPVIISIISIIFKVAQPKQAAPTSTASAPRAE